MNLSCELNESTFSLKKKLRMEKLKKSLIIVGVGLIVLFLGYVLLKVFGLLVKIGFFLAVIVAVYVAIRRLFGKNGEDDFPRLD